FYSEAPGSGDPSRDRARQNRSLPFGELVEGAARLLSRSGIFSVILPYREEDNFITLAKAQGLYLRRVCRVKGNPRVDFKRSLMEFGFGESPLEQGELIIEDDRHGHSAAYKALTQAFYLKM